MRRFAELWISVGLSCAALVFAGCGEDSDAGVGGNEPASCGNEVREGDEECDDGDEDDENECNNDCELNCGDGDVEGDEECDDGNSVNGDACTNQCVMGTGGSGDDDCGDGVLQAGEDCDDGNNSNTDACTIRCQGARCGDGYVQPGEACDDADTDDEDSCTTECRSPTCGDGVVDEGEECDDEDPEVCTENCLEPICGDGFVQGDEECDDGNASDEDLCTTECLLPICGDGFRQPGEACDDGNEDDEDECTTNCALASCGDGEVQEGEECDDGNDDEIACTERCIIPGCGDGIVTEDEDCDDANDSNADNCTNECTSPSCGDGFVQSGEQCDLGEANGDEGSTCTVACATEIDSGGGCDPTGGVRCVGDELQECNVSWETVQNCSSIGICRNGGCVDLCVENEVQIDDGNPCTDDFCDPSVGVAEHEPITGISGDPECSDNFFCTVNDACTEGVCGGTAAECSAIDECHDPGVCQEEEQGACTNPPKELNTPCTDSDACRAEAFCNETEECDQGEPIDFDDLNPCTADSCDPATGEAHDFLNVGVSCGDGDPCNGDELCEDVPEEEQESADETACGEGIPPSEDDGNDCTNDFCNETGVQHDPFEEGTSCDNGNDCEEGQDFCNATAVCVNADPGDIDDDNVCTDDTCDDSGVHHTNVTGLREGCGLGADLCEDHDECVAGACVPVDGPQIVDGNECTDDLCEGGVVSHPALEGQPCGDDEGACAAPTAALPNQGQCIERCNGEELCNAQAVCEPGAPLEASPVLLSVTRRPNLGSAANHNVVLPAAVDTGDLLLILFVSDGSSAVSVPAGGWTEVFEEGQDNTVRLTLYARIGDNDDDGDTVVIRTGGTTGAAQLAAAHIYRIEKGTWQGTIATAVASNTADSESADIDLPTLNLTWGTVRALFIAAAGHNDDPNWGNGVEFPAMPCFYEGTSLEDCLDQDFTGAPYRDESGTVNNPGTANDDFDDVTLLSSYRTAEVFSEDPGGGGEPPGDYDIASEQDWVSATIGVRGYCTPFPLCPAEEPDDNDSCQGAYPVGRVCPYEGSTCTCTNSGTDFWNCVATP